MSYSDPLVLTYPTAGAKSHIFLTRNGSLTGKGGITAEYMSSDQDFKVSVSHMQTGSGRNLRIRSVIRVYRRKVATDVLTAVQEYKECIINLVVDRPLEGFSQAEVMDQANALTAFLTSSASANVGKMYQLES